MRERKRCFTDPYDGHRVCCEVNLSGDDVCLAEDEFSVSENIPWLLYAIALFLGVFFLAILPWVLL